MKVLRQERPLEVTLTIPDDLADRLQPYPRQLPEVLELGIRELSARQEPGFVGVREVLETLASLPGPEEVLALRPSATLQARVSELLKKNRTDGLSVEEQAEWEHYQYVEHLVRLAKARAHLRLQEKKSA
jgi:hypothetical protein